MPRRPSDGLTRLPVNLILFEPAELNQPLPRNDRRAVHLLTVLRRSVGDSFDAGVVNGPRGKATLAHVGANALTLAFVWESETPPPLDPIDLIVGLPRPQTARDILRDATTLGVASLHFVATEKGEPSYAQSPLWSSGEWRRQLVTGAEQAFATRLPAVTHGRPLSQILPGLPQPSTRLALDNYEAADRLGATEIPSGQPVLLAIGAERGWSPAERAAFRAHGFALVHLGARVLRTETAVTAALAVVRARLGLM